MTSRDSYSSTLLNAFEAMGGVAVLLGRVRV